jgi:hypothetical protein
MSTLINISSKNLSVLEEGTTVVETTSAINFIGNCIIATNAGGGQANVTLKCGCDYEYISIASNACTILIPGGESSTNSDIFIGDTKSRTWSAPIWDFSVVGLNGNLLDIQKAFGSAIPIPTSIYPGDVIKLCGLVVKNKSLPCVESQPFSVYATVAVLTCNNLPSSQVTTLLPAQKILEDNNVNCFNLEQVSTTTYDGCETFFIVGFSIEKPDLCEFDVSFSYTLSVERYCPTFNPTPNLIAKNCCEEIITEVIPKGTLNVGNFYSDPEGNCWEIIAETGLAPNYVRDVENTYLSCEDCITSNVCPSNLIFTACCYSGNPETFTGSLPGINLGDTFVDTNGFCWTATTETSAPITGIVYVDTVYSEEDCTFCSDINPCPVVWKLRSCCKTLEIELYVTDASVGFSLSLNDVFVDTFGLCWTVKDNSVQTTDISTFIIFDSLIGNGNLCELCITSNPCPDPREDTYFYTVRNCCTGETEVVELPVIFIIAVATNGTAIFSQSTSPNVYECWELFSVSTSGIPTIIVANEVKLGRICTECLIEIEGCPEVFEVEDCCGILPNAIVLLPGNNTISGAIQDTSGNCWTILNPSVLIPTIIFQNWIECEDELCAC